MKPKLVDFYCGTFGSGEGYRQAGFDVTGVDNHQRRDLPSGVTFIKGDALELMYDDTFMRQFQAATGSPPCQTDSRTKHLRDAQGNTTSKLNLIPQTRDAFERSGLPYIIENVPESSLRADLMLCGSMFPELHVYDDTGRRWLKRHRVFESNVPLHAPCGCRHKSAGVRPLGVYASKADDIPFGGQTCRTLEQGRDLMGMSWPSWAGLIEAIPPAYTRWNGGWLLEALAG